jgi:hypothetical protein
VALDGAINGERSKQILGVVPAADRHHGRFDVLEMRAEIANLPELVVRAVPHQVVPKPDLPLEIESIRIGKRPELEIEVVAVGSLEVEPLGLLSRRVIELLTEIGKEAEIVGQIKRSVMMHIVTHEAIGNRRLRRGAFERRVGVDHAGRGIKARIGDSDHADAAVVVRSVLYEPVDRVISVGALVDVVRAGLDRLLRAHVDEFSL